MHTVHINCSVQFLQIQPAFLNVDNNNNNNNNRARIKDLEGQGHFQKGHFRLRRALWLSKKASKPSKKRHKGPPPPPKGQQIQGGDSDTFFFPTSKKKKKNPPKKQQQQQQQKKLADSSAHPQLTPLHSMQNALQCQKHALWSASAWITSINDQKKKKKLTLMFQNVQCFAHFVMIVRKFRTFTVFLRWIRRRKSQKISPRYDCDS